MARAVVLWVLYFLFMGCTPFAAMAASLASIDNVFAWQDGSVLRTGESINLSIKSVGEVSIDCGHDTGKLLFTYQAGKRVYPMPGMMENTSSTYHLPVDLTATNVASLKANLPLIKESCTKIRLSDWRVVTSDSDDITLVDVANLISSGPQISTWLAYDYPGLALDPPFQAPYAQKREFVHIDCNKRTWVIAAGYDVDDKDNVTDMALFPDVHFSVPSKDDLVIVDALCNPDKRNGLLPFLPRHKAPLASGNDDLNANTAVLANIHALDIAPAPKALKRYTVDGSSEFRGKPGESIHEDNALAFDAQTGLTHISKQGGRYRSEELSFLGFFDVASIGHFGHDKISVLITEARFYGDWKDMKVGSTFGYSAVRSMRTQFSPSPRSSAFESECTVESEVPASTVVSELTGTAKKIVCKKSTLGTDSKSVDHGYFLRDYGWYLQLKTDPNASYWSDLSISKVE